MKSLINARGKAKPWIWQIALFLAFTAGVILLLLWLAGKFEKKVSTEIAVSPSETKFTGPTERVKLKKIPLTETAVGSVRAVHETNIGSKLLARVNEVFIKGAGQKVKAGEVLFRLDDTDIKAKLQQAKAAVNASLAVAAQAEADAKRAEELRPSHAISQQDYEKAFSLEKSAKAEVDRTQEALKEAQATLDWATVRAPFDGDIVDKKVDVGDMVVPGQILTSLFNPDRMQLVAGVRDSLAGMLQINQNIGVQLEGIEGRCSGIVSEIVPESQTASRSFQVKVTGPCPPGVHAGRFGRIYIPLPAEQILAIPKAAVRNVGQLELVEVVENGKAVKRAVRSGRIFGNSWEILSDPEKGRYLEILSGLQEGEEIVVPNSPKPAQEANHG